MQNCLCVNIFTYIVTTKNFSIDKRVTNDTTSVHMSSWCKCYSRNFNEKEENKFVIVTVTIVNNIRICV